ncbi:MAG: Tim44-like domain-containing protein [Lautropia sp.]|nr:Tim44-like domain-containing protein [Lautropia sp.]
MKNLLMMLMVVLTSSFLFAADHAEAARLGGGRSIGRQNSTVQRVYPARQNNAAAANGRQQNAGQQGYNNRRPGFGMGLLGGLAAGLGLSALASAFGLGEGSGVMLMVLLLGGLAFIAFRMTGRRAQQQEALGATATGTTRQGFGAGDDQLNGPGTIFVRQHPDGTGVPFSHDAHGRQAGNGQAAVDAASAVGGYTAAMQVPGGFDTEAFVRQAKVQFIRLQAAFDARNADDLREFTSPEMFGELNLDMMQRGNEPQTTEVVELNGELMGMHQEGPILVASVHFSGLIRESAEGMAQPFAEIWNFTRPASGASGWVLAGIQQTD